MGETKPPLLTVIVPTCGRDTLERTIQSVRTQRDENNNYYGPSTVELLVVGDTFDGTFDESLERVPSLCAKYNAKYVGYDGGTHCFGHPQRNYGQSVAGGSWLIWLQDDDIYAEGAFRALLKKAKINGNMHGHWGVILGRTITWQAGVVWKQKILAEGNIDADCIAVPNVPERLGKWNHRYNGDFDFIRETCMNWDRQVLWFKEIIAIGRPRR